MMRQVILSACVGLAQAGYPTGPKLWKGDPLWKTSLLPLVVMVLVLWAVTLVCIAVYSVLRVKVPLTGTNARRFGGCGPVHTKQGFGDLEEALLEGSEMAPLRRGSTVMHPGGDVDFSPRAGGTPGSPRATVVKLSVPGGSQQAFTESTLGNVCVSLVWATSASLFTAYLVLLIDYYFLCQWNDWPDNLCFYGDYRIFGDYDTNSEALFLVWWLSLVWFGTVTTNAMRIRNFFRTPCRFDEALYVETCVPVEEEALVPNPGKIILVWRRLVKALNDKLGRAGGARHRRETLPVLSTAQGSRYFTFECERHWYIPPDGGIGDGSFAPSAPSDFKTQGEFHKAAGGLSSADADDMCEKLGPNQIPFEVDSVMTAVRKEFFTPFYLYQYQIYMIWVWFSNIPMGVPLSMIVVVCGVINVHIKLKNQKTIRKATVCDTVLEVFRDGSWHSMHCERLVPGDVIRVHAGCQVPCDAVVIRGAAICNEAALTGESAPVRKTSCADSEDSAETTKLVKHTLFSGTTVMQCGGAGGDEEVIAVVRKTGAATGKGELLKLILFPVRMVFKYDEELPVVVLLLALYAITVFILAIVFQLQNGAKKTWVTMWVYGIFTFSQTLSPLLPVALVVGQVNASRRLNDLGVFCINPARIAISGKVRVFCFDKTGTLTNEELDFLGVREVSTLGPGTAMEPGGFRPDSVSSDVLLGLATCHAVSGLGDTLVGNQVEVKMFRSTGWALIEERDRAPRVRAPAGSDAIIQRRYEFDHAAQTMSVVVTKPDGSLMAFVKGSPEKVSLLCEDVPEEMLSTAKNHALDGCYVLALACRELSTVDMSRAEIEAPGTLRFIGLILFRNELKPDTADAMAHLKAGDVRPVMITGDNAQCGFYIARSCGMIASDAKVFLAEVKQARGPVMWHRMGGHLGQSQGGSVSLEPTDEVEVVPLHDEQLLSTEDILAKVRSGDPDLELAVTGVAYDSLCACGAMEELLLHTRVFARVPPDGKVDIVTRHVRRGLVTGMAGDGGNDCGALRAAHAGIALSDAEASVVAPFTSRPKTITSCADLLREGRCSLCTSFAGYKFLITYGMIFPIVKLISFWYGVIMPLMAYFMVDVVAVCVLSYAMTLSKPQDRLPNQRPTSSLLGPTVVTSTLGLQLLNIIFMVGGLGMMVNDSDYVKWPADVANGASWWELGDNWEATLIFLFFHFQLTTASLSYTFGGPFRQPFWKNWLLAGSYAGLVGFGTWLMLSDVNHVTDAFHLATRAYNSVGTDSTAWKIWQERGNPPSPGMPFEFRLRLWFLLVASMSAGMLWEKVVVTGPVRSYFKAKRVVVGRVTLKL